MHNTRSDHDRIMVKIGIKPLMFQDVLTYGAAENPIWRPI
ncbi:hypothetical protein RHECNPAF_33400108 [Rhizobium etli CNPAF512]|nr:hypothetical protein RHECNPAF_33400108 [Rhizobium etli CNPAF512]